MDYFSNICHTQLLHRVSHAREQAGGRIDLTEESLQMQVSRIHLSEDSSVGPHSHATKTVSFIEIVPPEVWIVLNGSVSAALFDTDGSLMEEIVLIAGSVLITFCGGHAIKHCSLNTELFEIKLGPYTGNDKLMLGI